ncbi:MAG TPA: hypothetical protein PKA64_13685 [Myxococcota bacterium]|nr:hypothetical protein [Myxococcota bacterium]
MSNGRLLLVLGAWAALIPGIGALIYQERDLEPADPVQADAPAVTPKVVLLSYTREARSANLREMGLTGRALEAATARIQGDEQRSDDVLARLRAVNRDNLVEAFCTKQIPVIYRAGLLLLQSDGGRPRLAPFDADWGTHPWREGPWNQELQILFERWERQVERKPEDTVMAISAIVLGLANRAGSVPSPPWDRRSWEGGSFQTVVGANSDLPVEQLVGEYLGRAHFVAELVQANAAEFGCKAADDGAKKPP